MTTGEAFQLFERMISVATAELIQFTHNQPFVHEQKADKSMVTACDKAIDTKLTKLAQESRLQVVSEEGEHVLDIVRSGNYITIDPIDGTLGYIDYVNHALEYGDIQTFLSKDLGPEHDFCLLLGIVADGKPQYMACYNFITKEKIMLDANDKNSLTRENNIRNYSQENAIYLDQRFADDPITKELLSMPDVSPIKQATVGLKSLYTVLNPHHNAVMVHRVQTCGLWDIMPAAVAARAFGGTIYDDTGEPLSLTNYIVLPGKGATVIKGEKFTFVRERLLNISAN